LSDAQNQLETEEARALIGTFHGALEQIREQVRRVIVGQDEVVEHLLVTLLVGGHCLITGMPGTAKTLLVPRMLASFTREDSRYGGSFLGSLVMYEVDGRQYLLVPAASSAGGRGRGGPPAAAPAAAGSQPAPLGWVSFALPAKQP
jgi:hypothetical protein